MKLSFLFSLSLHFLPFCCQGYFSVCFTVTSLWSMYLVIQWEPSVWCQLKVVCILCVKGINFASFYKLDIWFMSCSDSMVSLDFILIPLFNYDLQLQFSSWFHRQYEPSLIFFFEMTINKGHVIERNRCD